MGHTSAEDLADLERELAEVRSWPDVVEKGPGVFYVRRTPFLHFHDKDGRRWADVRDGKTWGEELEIAFDASATARRVFLKEARARYETTLASLPVPRKKAKA